MKFTSLLQFVTPHKTRLLAIVILLLLGSGAALLQPHLGGEIVQLAMRIGRIKQMLPISSGYR